MIDLTARVIEREAQRTGLDLVAEYFCRLSFDPTASPRRQARARNAVDAYWRSRVAKVQS